MRARILRIDEPDFGCEGRTDELVVMDRVQLEVVETGEVFYTKAEDAWLYIKGINEGDMVEVDMGTKEILE